MPSAPRRLEALPPILGAALLVVLLAGCGSAGESREDTATYPPADSAGGNAALLTGALTSQSGCLVLVDDFGTTWIPVFPADARWRDDQVELGSGSVRVGGDAQLPGGEASSPGAEWKVPESCPSSAPYWVVVG